MSFYSFCDGSRGFASSHKAQASHSGLDFVPNQTTFCMSILKSPEIKTDVRLARNEVLRISARQPDVWLLDVAIDECSSVASHDFVECAR